MYSAWSVGMLICKRTRRSDGQKVFLTCSSTLHIRPAHVFGGSGPGETRTHKAMYSAPAVECVFPLIQNAIDEVVCQRLNGALPLSYGASSAK